MAGRNVANIRRGNAALNRFKTSLRGLPLALASAVASQAGPAMTGLTQGSFASQQNVYGDARPLGVDGQPLDLRRTGAVASSLGFRVTGTKIKAVLDQRYAKYLIGLYGILPNGAIPLTWRNRLDSIVHAVKVKL